ncbi:MAG: hypothetical protein V3S64_00505, partial [bacterium]
TPKPIAGVMRKRLHDIWRKMIRNVARTAPLLLLAALAGNAVWVGQGVWAQEADRSKVPTKILDTFDIDELRRILEIARESGFTEDDIKQMTVEDETGDIIDSARKSGFTDEEIGQIMDTDASGQRIIAWKVIEILEKRRKDEKRRRDEIQNRKYLTPQDVFKELDGGQKKDLKDLREKLFSR